jgi:hypothetical protein
MNNPTAANTAREGFRQLADLAVSVRDSLRNSGADHETISRADRILFAAQVGENSAAAELPEPEQSITG